MLDLRWTFFFKKENIAYYSLASCFILHVLMKKIMPKVGICVFGLYGMVALAKQQSVRFCAISCIRSFVAEYVTPK